MAGVQTGKTICLITTGHLTSDPRLVKEAMALSRSGFKIHLIFTQYVAYLVEHDTQILNNHPDWTYQSLNWTGNSFSSKINRLILKIKVSLPSTNETRVNRAFSWQLKKAMAYRADLYIAHNSGALAVAVIAAKKNKAKCGFDAEDFHRNEVSDDINDQDVKIKMAIEDKYIPQVGYMTASSPYITAEYTALFNRRIATILNVFPKIKLDKIVNNLDEPVKLFWFSQTIGPNRGLELIIEAINISKLSTELHLLGKSAEGYKKQLLDLAKNDKNSYCKLNFYTPISPDDIFKLAPKFDIGLASEPTVPFNRNICLTNKLFTYIQCGLAVAVSNTIAQKEFLEQYPEIGKLYTNANELAAILLEYNNDRKQLCHTKNTCLDIGQTILNWENESEEFLENIKNVLDQ